MIGIFIAFGVVLLAALLVLPWVFLSISKKEEQKAKNAISAKLIKRTAITHEKARNTGYSVGWKCGYVANYTYEEAVLFYVCKFEVVFPGGTKGTVECTENDEIYNILMPKTSKRKLSKKVEQVA